VPAQLVFEVRNVADADVLADPELVAREVLEDDADAFPESRRAPLGQVQAIERQVPGGVNVGLARPGPGGVDLVVWERGCGLTDACGTGACAAAVAGIRLGWLDRRVDVVTRGGLLTIDWAGGDAHVFMTGPAQTVFEGEITL
jgi:diaminopimelate epimerase